MDSLGNVNNDISVVETGLFMMLLLIKTSLLRLRVNILVCSTLDLTAFPNVIGELVIIPLLIVGV